MVVANGPGPHPDSNPSNVRVAAMSLIWGILSPADVSRWLEESAAAGYDGVAGFAEDFDSFRAHGSPMRRRLVDLGLDVAAFDWRMKDDESEYHAHFELMSELGCTNLVCIDPAGAGKDYRKLGAFLNRVGRAASEYHISIHYHNHTNSVGETFEDVTTLLGETDPNLVRVMLDLGHATKDFREFPPADRAITFLERNWDRIHYMEFKDWNTKTELNTPLGEGMTDYARVFTLMKSRGYSGWVTVEQNGNDGLSLGRSPLECARKSREFIRENLGV